MKSILLFLTLLLFSCTSSPTHEVFPTTVSLSPKLLALDKYTGEVITFTIDNPSALSLTLIPDIVIYTKIEDNKYTVQIKNEIIVKPSASFTFTFGGNVSNSNDTSLGIIIESTKEHLIYNYKELEIKPLSKKTFDLSINTHNLYYTKNSKNILITDEVLYGYINFYNEKTLFTTVPFTLQLGKKEWKLVWKVRKVKNRTLDILFTLV